MRVPLIISVLLLCSGGAYAGDPQIAIGVAAAPCPSTSLCVTADEAKRALLVKAHLDECEARETVLRDDHASELAAAREDEATERLRADRLVVLLAGAASVKPAARPWYEHPGFVAVVGVVAGAGLVLLSVYAAGAM